VANGPRQRERLIGMRKRMKLRERYQQSDPYCPRPSGGPLEGRGSRSMGTVPSRRLDFSQRQGGALIAGLGAVAFQPAELNVETPGTANRVLRDRSRNDSHYRRCVAVDRPRQHQGLGRPRNPLTASCGPGGAVRPAARLFREGSTQRVRVPRSFTSDSPALPAIQGQALRSGERNGMSTAQRRGNRR